MRPVQRLRRHPRFVLAVWFWGGAALAVTLAFAALWRTGGLWPPSLESVVRPETPPATAWRLAWSASAVTPERAGGRAAGALVGGLGALALLCLAMAAVNVGALLASRRARLRRDRAIRLGLGATPRDLGRERTAATRFLSAGAGITGVLAGLLAVILMRLQWPAGLFPPAPGVLLPALVLGAFAFAASLPRGGGSPEVDTRLLGGRTVSNERASRPRARIAGIQFALAVTVIATAGALLKAGRAGVVAPEEVATPDLLGIEVSLPGDTPTVARAAFFGALLDRLAEKSGRPGNETIASPGAWLGNGVRDIVLAECGNCVQGMMLLPVKSAFATVHMVSYGFMELLGMPVVAGRSFTPDDGFDSTRVAMVNETMARSSFERGQAIGRRVQVGGLHGEWYTVVGVVRDRVVRGLGAPSAGAPAIWLSVQQEPPFAVTVAVRTSEDEGAATERVQRAVNSLGLAGRLGHVTTTSEETEHGRGPLVWFAALYATLAALALLLALSGIRGLIRDSIRARQRELAIRTALGGRFHNLARVVLADTSRAVTLGAAFGFTGAFASGRFVQMRVPELRSLEPAVYLAITAALALWAVAAALSETRRITRAESARLLTVE